MSDISLLPKDLKAKEEEERKKARQASPLPEFKLHAPENSIQDNDALSKVIVPPSESWIQFGDNGAKKEEHPKSVVPPEKKITPVAIAPLPSRKPVPLVTAPKQVEPVLPRRMDPLPPKPKVGRPVFVEKKLAAMHMPEEQPDIVEGKRIISETADKIQELTAPLALMDYLKRAKVKEIFKKKTAELNLMSEDVNKIVRSHFWQQLKKLLFAAAAVVVVLSIVFLAVKAYQKKLNNDLNDLTQETKILESKINSFNTDQVQAKKLKTRAILLQAILEKHLYWTKLFSVLEKYTVDNVNYNNLAAVKGGELILSATGKSYEDVAKQLKVFENADFVKNVEINSASIAAEIIGGKESPIVQFNINIKMKDEALYK